MAASVAPCLGQSYRYRASARVTWESASADWSFTAMGLDLRFGTGRAANGKRRKGRSDAVRLLMEGKSSKGVSLRYGECGLCCGGLSGRSESGFTKRVEPHGW
jgi:hypothetical protein